MTINFSESNTSGIGLSMTPEESGAIMPWYMRSRRDALLTVAAAQMVASVSE